MIKATSTIGGMKNQGKTFSFLDAGRGIVASSIGVIGVLIFAFVVVGDISDTLIFNLIATSNSSILNKQGLDSVAVTGSSTMISLGTSDLHHKHH